MLTNEHMVQKLEESNIVDTKIWYRKGTVGKLENCSLRKELLRQEPAAGCLVAHPALT